MKNQFHPENGIVKRSFQFSLRIIEYCYVLENNRRFNMSYQLFRCGTSVGANVAEAQNAESKSDFIHKMKIASKEASETEYWLKLCLQSPNYPDCQDLLEELEPMIRIIGRIIITSKKSLTT